MKKLYVFLTKTLLCIILFLLVAIFCKADSGLKDLVYEKVYDDNISFSYFKNFYNQYLGGVFPIENISNNQVSQVFYEDLVYENVSEYEDGVALMVSESYLVPVIQDGIVVYIGEKEKYGNVVIVEMGDGVNAWYGNLCNVNVKLYDSVVAGSYLGETCSNILYLVFSNGNEYLDYGEYLK